MKKTNRSAVADAITKLVRDYAEYEDERHAHALRWRVPAREAYVMVERAKGRTLKDVGDDLELSRERVRQLESSGKRRITGWRKAGDTPAPEFRPEATIILPSAGGDEEHEARERELGAKVKELQRELSKTRAALRSEVEKQMPQWRRAVNAEQALKQAEALDWKRQYDQLYAEYMERVGALRKEVEDLKAQHSE